MSATLRGLFPVGITPFDERGLIDEDSLIRSLEFYIEAGANGIAHVLGGSEFSTLTDEERRLVTCIVTRVVDQRVPVMIGVTGLSPQHAVNMARYAEQCGANAVVSMPYYTRIPMSPSQIEEYYLTLGDAVNIPIIIQNAGAPFGVPMPPEMLAHLLQSIEHVDYVKEETNNAGHMISTLLKMASGACKGIFGGSGGHYILDEHRRGSCGTLPFPDVTDIHATLWDALEAGECEKARQIHHRLLPLYIMERCFGVNLCKEILRQRGVISTATLRIPGRILLDDIDREWLATVLVELRDMFTCYPDITH
jgi:4-hydroxy-tetrahydrodipicolinate synthase